MQKKGGDGSDAEPPGRDAFSNQKGQTSKTLRKEWW